MYQNQESRDHRREKETNVDVGIFEIQIAGLFRANQEKCDPGEFPQEISRPTIRLVLPFRALVSTTHKSLCLQLNHFCSRRLSLLMDHSHHLLLSLLLYFLHFKRHT